MFIVFPFVSVCTPAGQMLRGCIAHRMARKGVVTAKDAWQVWGTGLSKKRADPDGYRLGIVLRPCDGSKVGCSVVLVLYIGESAFSSGTPSGWMVQTIALSS